MSEQFVPITRESLQILLNDPRPDFVMHVVGKALVGLFQRQTADEQRSDTTNKHNTIGFAGCDAKCGSLTAKSYMKNKKLQPWQVELWTRINPKTKFPRLCKYHRQLNEIALEKWEQKHGH